MASKKRKLTAKGLGDGKDPLGKKEKSDLKNKKRWAKKREKVKKGDQQATVWRGKTKKGGWEW